MKKKIIVECKPDEILAKLLGFSRKEIAHENNKGEVCKYLEKSETGLAIIDEDPGSGQPNYLKSFKIAEEKFGTKRLINSKFAKTIIILKPRLEEWVLMQCKISEIDPGDFHLPDDPNRLKDVINLRLDHFQDLLAKLKDKANDGLIYLQKMSQGT